MKWKTLEEVPERLRKIGGADLTVEQANAIGEWAGEYEKNPEVRNAWGMAVVKFKRLHRIIDGRWVRREGEQEEVFMRRVAVKFSRKYFRDAADAEQWLERNMSLPVSDEKGVEDLGDAYYYMIQDVRDTLGKCREGSACGLGVTYLYSIEKGSVEEIVDEQAADDVPVTYDIEDVEIFRAGTWKDSAGRETSYSVEELEDMAAAYNELKDRFEAPVKLGHDSEQVLLQADGMPAAGWLANLRVVGESLMADLKSVPKKVYEILKMNGFKKRSLEVIHNFQDEASGKVYGHMAAGLALLGAQLPAIGSLSELRALYSGDGGQVAYFYESGEEGITLEEVVVADVPPEEKSETVEEMLKAVRATVERVEKKVIELSERCTAECRDGKGKDDAEIAAADNSTEETGDTVSDYGSCYANSTLDIKSDALEKHLAKIPPAHRDSVRRIYKSLAGDGRGVSNYGNGAARNNALAEFENMIESLGEHGAMREYGRERNRAGGTGVMMDDTESRVSQYCRENGLDINLAGDYARAVMAVSEYRGAAFEG